MGLPGAARRAVVRPRRLVVRQLAACRGGRFPLAARPLVRYLFGRRAGPAAEQDSPPPAPVAPGVARLPPAQGASQGARGRFAVQRRPQRQPNRLCRTLLHEQLHVPDGREPPRRVRDAGGGAGIRGLRPGRRQHARRRRPRPRRGEEARRRLRRRLPRRVGQWLGRPPVAGRRRRLRPAVPPAHPRQAADDEGPVPADAGGSARTLCRPTRRRRAAGGARRRLRHAPGHAAPLVRRGRGRPPEPLGRPRLRGRRRRPTAGPVAPVGPRPRAAAGDQPAAVPRPRPAAVAGRGGVHPRRLHARRRRLGTRGVGRAAPEGAGGDGPPVPPPPAGNRADGGGRRPLRLLAGLAQVPVPRRGRAGGRVGDGPPDEPRPRRPRPPLPRRPAREGAGAVRARAGPDRRAGPAALLPDRRRPGAVEPRAGHPLPGPRGGG